MKHEEVDIVDLLEKEKQQLLTRLQRVNIALSALKGETTEPIVKKVAARKIQWASEIRKLLSSDNISPTEEILIDGVRNKLAEKGIAEALEEKNRSTVATTLARMATVSNEGIEKIRPGVYRKKTEKTKEHAQSNTNNENMSLFEK